MDNMSINTMGEAWDSSELTGANAAYLEMLYERYLENPQSVEPSLRSTFEKLKGTEGREVRHSDIRKQFVDLASMPVTRAPVAPPGTKDSSKLSDLMNLIYAYRFLGHRHADLDPLKLSAIPEVSDLTLVHHGLSSSDADTTFDIKDLPFSQDRTLKSLDAELRRIYCGAIGYEYMHITDNEEKEWLRAQIEDTHKGFFIDANKKRWLLERLIATDGLEKYLGMKYVGAKRFSLEGVDSLIPMLDELITISGNAGIKEIIFAMAHRGRINVLINTMGKSSNDLFDEFEGKPDENLLSGDVKYHMGFSSDVKTEGGLVHLSLGYNPSHLEIVSPVVEGSVRARQERRGERKDQVLAIHMHGDAAFIGQGVVMETLNMSKTQAFDTGGSIHIVINNQIGFTTDAQNSRSSYYCTGIAKMVEAPIFHVNADDPEAVLKVVHLAFAYRSHFHKDVVIDLIGYRRHGHNEADEPSGTQPKMYKAIKQQPVLAKGYEDHLIREGVITAEEASRIAKAYRKSLEAGESVVELIPAEDNLKFIVDWSQYLGTKWDMPYDDHIDKQQLIALSLQLTRLPKDFVLQKQVAKMYNDWAKMSEGELPINWGFAEVLAYATLLAEQHPIRLCGEDIQRGTFSHRHVVLHDQNTYKTYRPLDHIANDQAKFEVYDSVLSEEAVLAFEYGYACASPESLVVWEAQFGDFVNTAQVVIDQFISSAEEKWGRLSGLVLLLPHGMEGMGAEHSSARLERFLQLCAHHNMQVCYPTTPAQIYHLLRRQVIRDYRKPLIVMTPKSLLRYPKCVSSLDDLAKGKFQVVIDEPDKLPLKSINRVIICSGKVYYDLLAKRTEQSIDNIAIIRLEQLYPFPREIFKQLFSQYSHVEDIIWCQEEPKNQGAWYVIQHYLSQYIKSHQRLSYVGRDSFSAPAVGYPPLHKKQQEKLVNQALKLIKE